MSVLVYTENWKGTFRKSTFEAVSYASETAKLLRTNVIALSFGEVTDDELSKLGNYGVNKVLSATGVNKGDSEAATNLFAENVTDATIIIFPKSITGLISEKSNDPKATIVVKDVYRQG